jgi:hypothetical protein
MRAGRRCGPGLQLGRVGGAELGLLDDPVLVALASGVGGVEVDVDVDAGAGEAAMGERR